MAQYNSKRWQEVGPWVPYPRPVEGFGVAYDPETLMFVCFPAQFYQYLMGAAKVLAQVETWQGDDTNSPSDYANFGNDLLTRLAGASDGCPEAPSSSVSLFDFDFTADDGGFVVQQINGQDAGVWTTGVGWEASIVDTGGFGSTRYQKRLSLRKDLGAAYFISGLNAFLSYSVDLAPGGGDWRLQRVQFTTSPSGGDIQSEFFSRPSNDCLNMEWGATWSVRATSQGVYVDMRCGADSSSATLVAPSLTLKELWVWYQT